MKLNRCDILALLVLAVGLAAQCLGPTEGARFAGAIVSGVGLVGCIMTFLVGEDR